jgi:predicted RND superfamily exporter protein
MAENDAAPDPLAQQSIRAIYTGVVPIVYKSQRKLLEGLISSTVWSFLTITPLMMFVCRGIWPGLVVMIPNTLPVLVVFGGMGWLGVPVDIGSMMAASIALGVAVDDTIHFMSWFRQSAAVCTSRQKAIVMAYRHCASPTTQTALISGLGLSVFTLSSFTPTQRLGYLMLTILFAGVVAELFMLPALLAGPLGRVFKTRNSSRKEEPQIEPVTTTSSDSAVPRPKMHSRPKTPLAS